jgi:hypothetical protein
MSGKKQSIFDEESFVLDDNTLAQSVDSSADKATATSDFLFLIDCTNTMDWVLDTLVNTILEVADIFNEDALRMRYGVVEFRDMLRDMKEISMVHHEFKGSHFTDDPLVLKKCLTKLEAKGGGPPKESIFEAIKTGIEQSDWRDDASKFLVILTDSEGPILNDYSVKGWPQCIEIIEKAEIDMLHVVRKEEFSKNFVNFSQIDGKDGEDLAVTIHDIGVKETAQENLKKVLRGIGYSSRKKARSERNKKRFRD